MMRVLVAYEEMYRSYRSVIAKAIEDLRPHLQVRCVPLGAAMEEALVRFDPHVVICSRPSAEYPMGGSRAGWVEMPVEPAQAGDICLEGEHEGAANPDLRKVLSVLDEAEEKLRRGELVENC
jgi:hypothetical protein